MTKRPRTALVAVGGNALIIDNDHKSIPDQAEAAARMSSKIADMVEAGWRVVVTHGNLGDILIETAEFIQKEPLEQVKPVSINITKSVV